MITINGINSQMVVQIHGSLEVQIKENVDPWLNERLAYLGS